MIKNILNLIFPPKCIFCSKIMEPFSEIEVCNNCYNKIPFKDDGAWTALQARLSNNHCDEILCVCDYSGIIKSSLLRYKFYERSSYYKVYGKLLSRKVKKVTNSRNFDIIISVPLSRKKESIRGYNQSYLISKTVSKELGVLEGSNILSRTRDTRTQSLLRKEERNWNTRDAFEVKAPKTVENKDILLIDDIMTTGSTLDECARVLKLAGAKTVTGAVIASGKKY